MMHSDGSAHDGRQVTVNAWRVQLGRICFVIAIGLGACAALMALSGCNATGEALKDTLHQELLAWPGDLRDAAKLPTTTPELAAKVTEIADEIEAVHAMYHAAIDGAPVSTSELLNRIQSTVALADALVAEYGENAPPWMPTALFFTKAALRRVSFRFQAAAEDQAAPTYKEATAALEQPGVSP